MRYRVPYKGKFKITQVQHSNHDGFDIVGLESKKIQSTINGKVIKSGWENPWNHKQGFGFYIVILEDNTNNYHFFGHLSKSFVKAGNTVFENQLIGIEGNTGYSTGSHCHYCIRENRQKIKALNISKWTGVPNFTGVYNNDWATHGIDYLKPGFWRVRNEPNFTTSKTVRIVRGLQSVTYVDIIQGFYKLRDGNYISVKACKGGNK